MERLRKAWITGDRDTFRDVIVAAQEHAPEDTFHYAMLAGYTVLKTAFQDEGAFDERHLQAAMAPSTPTAILKRAGLLDGLRPVEQAKRVASVLVAMYNDGPPQEKRLSREAF